MESLRALHKMAAELLGEYKVHIIVISLIFVTFFIGGGIYRVWQGKAFWGEAESQIDRNKRLRDCAAVYYDNQPAYAQIDDDGNAGVCRGFTRSEVDDTRSELGL